MAETALTNTGTSHHAACWLAEASAADWSSDQARLFQKTFSWGEGPMMWIFLLSDTFIFQAASCCRT